MSTEVLDTVGMKCPQPLLRLAVKAPQMEEGNVLQIRGDCPTFEHDIRTWCERIGKTLLSVKLEGTVTAIDILF